MNHIAWSHTALCRLCVYAMALVVLLHVRLASAHAVGISRGEYRVEGPTLDAELTFAVPEILLFLPDLDRDHDRTLDSAELAAGRASLESAILHGLLVTADGAPCTGAFGSAVVHAEDDGIVIKVHYAC